MSKSLPSKLPSKVLKKIRPKRSYRSLLLGIYELGKWATMLRLSWSNVQDYLGLLCYTNEYPNNKRKKPVNVDELVAKWVETIYGITFSHSKAEADRWEHGLNDVLTPLLTAPIKQLREFYPKLVTALKEDKRIPLVVWSMFEGYGKTFLKDATDDEYIKLKEGLAKQIALLAEEDLKPQLVEALTNALMWRDPKNLKKIKTALEKGNKPRLKGKESCLFMEVGEEIIQL